MGPLSCLRSFHRQLASAGCAAQSGAVFVGASVPGADVSLRAYRFVVVSHFGGARVPGKGLARASGRCLTLAWGKGRTAGPSTSLRSGRDDNSVGITDVCSHVKSSSRRERKVVE